MTSAGWYALYLQSPRWRLLRSYRHRGAPGLLGFVAELRDTITLCAECHAAAHKRNRREMNKETL